MNDWIISCVVAGPVFIALGARAGGLALLAAVVGALLGLVSTSSLDQLPQGITVGATVAAFIGGLAGLAWRPPSQSSAKILGSLGLVTIVVGFVAAWVLSQQACGGVRDARCLPDVDGVPLELFVLDAVWVAALCFIQAAQSHRSQLALPQPG